MEREVIMNAFHHVVWGVPLSIYFWLMGVSAGAHVISGFGWVFGLQKYKQVGLISTLWAIGVLLLVPVMLIFDLGRPERFFHLMTPGYWHGTAPMAWGSILIVLYPAMMTTYAYFVYKKNAKLAFTFGICSILSAASTHWYTGVVMQLNPSRELNHTALASLLFLVGAFISGTGFLVVTFYLMNIFVKPLKRFRDRFREERFINNFLKANSIGDKVEESLIVEIGQIMSIGLGVELLMTFNEFLQMSYGSEEEQANLFLVLLGIAKTPYFAHVFIALLIPFIVLVFTPLKRKVWCVTLSAAMVCFGIFGMRVWWVLGGQFLQSFF